MEKENQNIKAPDVVAHFDPRTVRFFPKIDHYKLSGGANRMTPKPPGIVVPRLDWSYEDDLKDLGDKSTHEFAKKPLSCWPCQVRWVGSWDTAACPICGKLPHFLTAEDVNEWATMTEAGFHLIIES